jgi:hypothetical protein
MHWVFNTTQIFTSIAIALSIGSCSSNTPNTTTAQNPSTNENAAALSMATTPIPSIQTTPASPVLVADSAAAVVPVPSVSPLTLVTDLHGDRSANISANPQLAKSPSRPYRARNSSVSPTPCRSFPCLVLSESPQHLHNQFNNPIYKLTAYRDNTSSYIFQLNAVTGRAFTQSRNRYQSLTEAPLPDGSYSVTPRVVRGTIPEVGGTMVPIFPKRGFDPRMRRTALGIHWDPSFDRDKSEDGTSGCIGLTSKSDYHRVRNFVLKYRPRSLEVQIDR